MTFSNIQALLPSGFADILSQQATARIHSTHLLLQRFMGFGYQPVIPPMLEYAHTMLAQLPGHAQASYFQMKDMQGGEMLALRADVTPQITRIAENGLKHAPRPLRLCYAAPRVLAHAEALQSRREHLQIGGEYIGATGIQAEIEIIAMALQALKDIRLDDLTLEIHLPALTRLLIQKEAKEKQAPLETAILRKDAEALHALGAAQLCQLMQAHGKVAHFLEALALIECTTIQAHVRNIKTLHNALVTQNISINITVDALDIEHEGRYTGISFSILSTAHALEVARGGRYNLNDGEEAVGFTLYLEEALAHVEHVKPPVIAVPTNTNWDAILTLQGKGFQTILTDDFSDERLALIQATHSYQHNNIEERQGVEHA